MSTFVPAQLPGEGSHHIVSSLASPSRHLMRRKRLEYSTDLKIVHVLRLTSRALASFFMLVEVLHHAIPSHVLDLIISSVIATQVRQEPWRALEQRSCKSRSAVASQSIFVAADIDLGYPSPSFEDVFATHLDSRKLAPALGQVFRSTPQLITISTLFASLPLVAILYSQPSSSSSTSSSS